MSTALRKRLVLILSMLLVACTVIAVGLFGFANASTSFSLSEMELKMETSGEIMVDGENGKDGLKFTMKTPLGDYEELVELVGSGKAYKSVEAGIIIVPEYYNDNVAIGETSLFGENASYDWAEWDEVVGNYVYNGEKIRIININANSWKTEGNYKVYEGAIVDILSGNEAKEFYAVGYIKLTDANGEASYKFTSNSVVTSPAYETQVEIEEGILSGDKAEWAQENYVEKVTTKYSYTTEYYKKTASGYELMASEVSEEKYALDVVVEAEEKDYSAQNLEVDESAENVLSGKVKANDRLTLKVYYREAKAEVVNFETASNIVVTKGAKVLIETPAPIDQYGQKLNVYYDVMDANG